MTENGLKETLNTSEASRDKSERTLKAKCRVKKKTSVQRGGLKIIWNCRSAAIHQPRGLSDNMSNMSDSFLI